MRTFCGRMSRSGLSGSRRGRPAPGWLPCAGALGMAHMIIRSIAGGVEVLAPAKLNLFLEVLARRPDGYHEIESLMVAVSLYDSLTFTDDPSGEISLRCNEPTLPVGGDNLVVMAAERLEGVGAEPSRGEDRAGQGDPRRVGAGWRLERRGSDARGTGPAMGSARRRLSGCRRWRRRSAATWPSSPMDRPRFAAGGASGWSRFLSRKAITSFWFVRRSE